MTTLSASAPLFITERVQAAGATIRLSQATMIESVLAELMLGEFKPKWPAAPWVYILRCFGVKRDNARGVRRAMSMKFSGRNNLGADCF